MLATTISDLNIPPAWNTAVFEIRQAASDRKPAALPDSVRSWSYSAGNAVSTAPMVDRSIQSLGWTQAEALETYLRLRTFAEDWDAPGMEVYDDL